MRILGFAALTAGFLAGSAWGGAGFDCAKAKTPEEKLICSDAGLTTADGSLAAAYGKVLVDKI